MLLATVLLVMFNQPLVGQDSGVNFVQQFQQVQQELPRERIHIHTDRQWYVEGDIIWFSAYVGLGATRQRGSLGTRLHVELVDPNGSITERISLELQGGRASGLLRTGRGATPNGSFIVRAYTAWALNFGESYITEIPVHIFSDATVEAVAAASRATRWRRLLARSETNTPSMSANDAIPADPGLLDVQFLPEGGPLLDGVSTRVAFKALHPDGHAADVSGFVISADGDRIPFASEHRGMGVVTITPRDGVHYFAEINGHRYMLPEVQASGVTLSVQNTTEFADVRVYARGIGPVPELVLFAHVRGEVYVAARMLLDEHGFGEVRLGNDLIPTGIVHYTVLDPEGRPAAERLVFNHNDFDKVQVDAVLAASLEKRQRGELSLTLRNDENQPVSATVSISVFDDEIFTWDPWKSTIVTRLNLESELRGYVEAPGYYFTNAPQAAHHLDLLLLTQGWRSYNIPKILDVASLQPVYQPEYGFSVEGKLLSRLRRRAVTGAFGALSRGNNYDDFQVFTSDQTGHFRLENVPITGREAMNFRATRANGRGRVWIELEPSKPLLTQQHTPPQHTAPSPVAAHLMNDTLLPEALLSRTAATQQVLYAQIDVSIFGELDAVIVTADREPPDSFERSLRTGERPSQRIDMDSRSYLQDLPLSQVINQMNGVSMTEQQGLNMNTGFVGNYGAVPQPLVIIDGIVVDESALWLVETADVQSLNVFRRSSEAAFWGSRSAGGVIVLHTRTGEAGPPRDGLGYLTKIMEGFQPFQQFYAPAYALATDRASTAHDGRITLHWTPLLNVLPAGSATGFWSGDVSSTFRVVVEGLTTSGVPFSYTTTFDVD